MHFKLLVVFVDESNFCAGDRSPYSWVKRGAPKYIYAPSRQRQRLNLLAAVDMGGPLALMKTPENGSGRIFVAFLQRLLEHLQLEAEQ